MPEKIYETYHCDRVFLCVWGKQITWFCQGNNRKCWNIWLWMCSVLELSITLTRWLTFPLTRINTQEVISLCLWTLLAHTIASKSKWVKGIGCCAGHQEVDKWKGRVVNLALTPMAETVRSKHDCSRVIEKAQLKRDFKTIYWPV